MSHTKQPLPPLHAGGGFRDSLSDISEELCPSSGDVPVPLPFFVRTPNQVWHPGDTPYPAGSGQGLVQLNLGLVGSCRLRDPLFRGLCGGITETSTAWGLIPWPQYFGVSCFNTCRAI